MFIDVLLVDDDEDYAQSLKGNAALENINIFHVKTLVEMKQFLPKVISGISVIILDIKGMLTPEDKFDDEGFLAQAITYLDKEYYTKPRVILTGDVDGFNYMQKFRNNERVYRKGNTSEKEMFNYIKEVHEKLDEIVISKQYEDVFEVFERGLLNISRKGELIEIIKNIDSNDSAIMKNSLGRIRDIQEDIIAKINQVNKTLLPDNKAFNRNREISFRKSHDHILSNAMNSGYEYPKFISEVAITTYSISCDFGVHTTGSTNNTNLKPSSYTVKNALYSLFEFIRWFKTVI
ncbi:hypothetical protein [Tepidibacter mesophilus]|uniref:hypothetical protein n=1 Tax=Tepidibacter mesophilus TaxID=655607 RepID=UPI000C089F0F|nr:hypothetical protein [Tepidibacter mesophilus]